mgnify:CR=1 FL=1
MRYDVAIITVSTNKLDEECLSSVKTMLDLTPLRSCFVVVDNGSTVFDAHTYLRNAVPDAIVILRNRNHGFGRSCNHGAVSVQADYYFFLNPDTVVNDTNILSELRDFLKKHAKIGIAAPKIVYPDGRLQETCRRFPAWYTPIAQRTDILPKRWSTAHREWFAMGDYNHETARPVDWVQGSAFLIDGDLFRKLGGFDERFFMYYEDVDLCRRCWGEGRAVYYLPSVSLTHTYGKESAQGTDSLNGILRNKKTRAHIHSWLAYTAKWLGESV